MSLFAVGCGGSSTPDGGVDGGEDGGMNMDGGMDAGVADAGTACTAATQATACNAGGTATNPIYSACTAAAGGVCSGTCSGTMGSGTDCNWGDQCGAGGTGLCAFTTLASCGRAAHAPAFSPGQPPLITAISATYSDTSDPNNECTDGLSKVEALITFEAPGGLTFSGQASFNAHVIYVKADGTTTQPAFTKGRPTSPAMSGSFTAGLCLGGGTSLTDGVFVLKDDAGLTGNAACFSAP